MSTGLSLLPAPQAAAAVLTPAQLAPVTFGFTGANQTYMPPKGVTDVRIRAVGGTGARGPLGPEAGRGADVTFETKTGGAPALYVSVGQNGQAAPRTAYNGGGAGGLGGTSSDPRDPERYAGGGGGGFSAVTVCALGPRCTLRSALVVAAGGGGGGGLFDHTLITDSSGHPLCNCGPGGNAGMPGGTTARGAEGGGAGTVTAPGAGGAGSEPYNWSTSPPGGDGSPGSFQGGGSGGNAPPSSFGFSELAPGGGGGGGGGYFGGGGGGSGNGDGVSYIYSSAAQSGAGGGGGASTAAGPATFGLDWSSSPTPLVTITPVTATTTTVRCATPRPPGKGSRCVARVTNAATGFPVATGAVSWSVPTGTVGEFVPSSCTLDQSGRCAVIYQAALGPPQSQTVTARYAGDTNHKRSAGSQVVFVNAPKADLIVSQFVGAAPSSGQAVVNVAVTNKGPETGSGLTLTNRLQSSLFTSLSAASSPGGSCRVGSLSTGEVRVNCTLDSLAPNATWTVVLTVGSAGGSAVQNTANVSSAQSFDPNPATNNSVIAATVG